MDTVRELRPAETTERRASLGLPHVLLREAGGALGDLGTFVPLAVGMVQIAGLDAGTLLVTAGLVNIWSGWQFRMPMAVQPMKAIAALAIAGTLSGTQAMAAGFFVGVALLALGMFGLVRSLARFVPPTVLRGLQLTIASELLLRGASRVFAGVTWRPISAPEMVPLALVAGAAVVVWVLRRRLEWVSIGLLAVAVLLAAWHEPSLLRVGSIGVWRPHRVAFTLRDLDGVWRGGLPQLALTLLNSVLAVTSLAGQLYPQHAAWVTPTRMALSVGIMNLLVCPLGGMPLCHGSGGLAGQHKMGARSGLSVILLGLAKLTLGLLMGGVALVWMRAFPPSILGLFLLLAGWSLAEASRAWDTRLGTAVSLLMLVTYYATASLPLAFGAGWIVWWSVQRVRLRVASAAVCLRPRGETA
jgi:hypothetical protein